MSGLSWNGRQPISKGISGRWASAFSSRRLPMKHQGQMTSETISICMPQRRSEEHTSELQSLMRISYAVFCLKKKKKTNTKNIEKKTKEAKHKINAYKK